jgi:hypothetical protein
LLKIDLLNNAGIQSEENQKQGRTPQPAEKQVKISKVKKSTLNAENKKRMEDLKKNLKTTVPSGKRKKRSGIKIFVALLIVLIIGSGSYYLYTNPQIIQQTKQKMMQLANARKERAPQPVQQPVEKEIPLIGEGDEQKILTSAEVGEFINKNSVNLNIFSGMMELLPKDAILYDLNMKQSTLSLICIVNDNVRAEDLKFYMYNHKNELEPELFYIEKAEKTQGYQITSLTKFLNTAGEPAEYIYLDDRGLSGRINAIVNHIGASMTPLTISKRDPSITRDAYITLKGNKNQMIRFIREIKREKMNIAITGLEFVNLETLNTMQQLRLKINMIICPQSI